MAAEKLPHSPAVSHNLSGAPMPPWPEPEPAPEPKPVKSYAHANSELAEAFGRYLEARGQSKPTLRAYGEIVGYFLESLASKSVIDADRGDIRQFQSSQLDRGVHENTLRLRTQALRAFFKFLRLTGLTKGHDPTLILSYRKLPRRLPRVLTIAEIEKLISAAKKPVEAAIAELLYATGVRVSELVNIRLEDVNFVDRVIRVKNGKGGKDRIVLFGRKALSALRNYLGDRKPTFLFEVQPGAAKIYCDGRYWRGIFFDKNQHRSQVRYLGTISDLPNLEAAARKFERDLKKEPGYRAGPAKPYSTKAIRSIIGRLSARAGIGHVHPHALRRAFACHMLAGGADLRVIQELLGHTNLTTTMLYTSLSGQNLKEIHDRCHPHAREENHAEEK